MANSVHANVQNNIISQSALEQFASILAPLNAFSTSFNDEASQRGNKVTILNLGNTSSAKAFDPAKGYETQDVTYGQTQINLSTHKFVTWHITDRDRLDSSAVELERFGYQKGADLAKEVFQDICKSITNANFGSKKIALTADFDADDVADMRSTALTNNLPIEGCSLVLNNGHFTNLLKDSAVASALNYGSSDAIRGGNVPSLFGIPSVYETNSVPTNSENLQGFLAHPCGLAVAMRYLEPSNSQEYISARRISDPKSGLVMGYREFYDAKMGVQTAVLECLYGKAKGRPEGIVRLVTA